MFLLHFIALVTCRKPVNGYIRIKKARKHELKWSNVDDN